MFRKSYLIIVAGYNFEGEQLDPKEFFESIDQLALAFSSR
jgi:hypothetical protein